MKQSMRAKRMARNHKRRAAQGKLSLVSLMDIFTILVFFLMLNASDVQVLQTHKSVSLPKSTAQNPAKETVLILVNGQDLIVQGRKVADVQEVMATAGDDIEALSQELNFQARKQQSGSDIDTFEGAVTIMGDQALPYQLLKKIMTTSAQSGFTNISLAVEQIESSAIGGE